MSRGDIQRTRILGAPIDIVDMPGAMERVNQLVNGEKLGNTIFALNPRKVISLSNNSSLKAFFENAALIIADGYGIVIAARWLLGKKIERITGIDLMLSICQLATAKGYKIFIFGAEERDNRAAVEKLRVMYPGISIVGRSNGYIPKEDVFELIEKINESKADILFVALGSPKQENFLEEYLPILNVKICQGIGGALEVISERRKRAPMIYQKLGLEWVYRLIYNPSRYSNGKYLLIFLVKLLKCKLLMRNNTSHISSNH